MSDDDDTDRTDELLELIAEDERREKAISNGQHPDDPGPEPPPDEPPEPHPLDALHQRCRYWFGEYYDLDAIDATLAAAAVERLDGDPL
jgi:hypothetical protein